MAIGEKKNEINLVRVETRLPDMEIYELIEKMKNYNILFFIITAYDEDIPPISKAPSTRAKLCFRKLVQTSNLQHLWRFTVWNRFEPTFNEKVFDYWWPMLGATEESKGLKCQPSMNTKEQSLQSVSMV
ncbi:hypothetical protein P8452_46336 [Trifolium repens]|nr:hypothetical protein P8452_46336 [Trifolium repens]